MASSDRDPRLKLRESMCCASLPASISSTSASSSSSPSVNDHSPLLSIPTNNAKTTPVSNSVNNLLSNFHELKRKLKADLLAKQHNRDASCGSTTSTHAAVNGVSHVSGDKRLSKRRSTPSTTLSRPSPSVESTESAIHYYPTWPPALSDDLPEIHPYFCFPEISKKKLPKRPRPIPLLADSASEAADPRIPVSETPASPDPSSDDETITTIDPDDLDSLLRDLDSRMLDQCDSHLPTSSQKFEAASMPPRSDTIEVQQSPVVVTGGAAEPESKSVDDVNSADLRIGTPVHHVAAADEELVVLLACDSGPSPVCDGDNQKVGAVDLSSEAAERKAVDDRNACDNLIMSDCNRAALPEFECSVSEREDGELSDDSGDDVAGSGDPTGLQVAPSSERENHQTSEKSPHRSSRQRHSKRSARTGQTLLLSNALRKLRNKHLSGSISVQNENVPISSESCLSNVKPQNTPPSGNGDSLVSSSTNLLAPEQSFDAINVSTSSGYSDTEMMVLSDVSRTGSVSPAPPPPETGAAPPPPPEAGSSPPPVPPFIPDLPPIPEIQASPIHSEFCSEPTVLPVAFAPGAYASNTNEISADSLGSSVRAVGLPRHDFLRETEFAASSVHSSQGTTLASMLQSLTDVGHPADLDQANGAGTFKQGLLGHSPVSSPPLGVTTPSVVQGVQYPAYLPRPAEIQQQSDYDSIPVWRVPRHENEEADSVDLVMPSAKPASWNLRKQREYVMKRIEIGVINANDPVHLRMTPSVGYFSCEDPNHVVSSRKRRHVLDDSQQKNSLRLYQTEQLASLELDFLERVLIRSVRARDGALPPELPPRKLHVCVHRRSHNRKHDSDSDSSTNCSTGDEDENEDPVARINKEAERKRQHPHLLDPELWYNEPGEKNDGPECSCSAKARATGIRHHIFPGEQAFFCDPLSNNADSLFHYRVEITPEINFLAMNPTVIKGMDNKQYRFSGFSILSHVDLDKVPYCRLLRYSRYYDVYLVKETPLKNVTISSLDLISDFLFRELFDLYDLCWRGVGEVGDKRCPQFHFFPRFIDVEKDGSGGADIEMLSVDGVLRYLITHSGPFIDPLELPTVASLPRDQFALRFESAHDCLVTFPGRRPSCVRVDGVKPDTLVRARGGLKYPTVLHDALRPAQLTSVDDNRHRKLMHMWRKELHLLANKPRVEDEDRERIGKLEIELAKFGSERQKSRRVCIGLDTEIAFLTGLRCDVAQHALYLPKLVHHLRFHQSLVVFEGIVDHTFNDRHILHRSLVHPSYEDMFGTNPDHIKNSMANCGHRRVNYGSVMPFKSSYPRRRGISQLIDNMAAMVSSSNRITHEQHYERLEYLGDAVLELIVTRHLYFLFPQLEEGGLTSLRYALVNNQFLSLLAHYLNIESFMLFSHLQCHHGILKHAHADVFEAVIGALFLDGGFEVAEKLFGRLVFRAEKNKSARAELARIWNSPPLHPIQAECPDGDRHLIPHSELLQKFVELEERMGMRFKHIRILVRAFTPRFLRQNHLTLGDYERLEMLGDSVLKFAVSDFLYRNFPMHHEGHLSLLRGCLVSNQTQAQVCEDLGLLDYLNLMASQRKSNTMSFSQSPAKTRADLVESLLGALYVDSGCDLKVVRAFCDACFFPRIEDFLLAQEWNDSKSMLQQACLTLRRVDDPNPEKPAYKIGLFCRIGTVVREKLSETRFYSPNRLLSVNKASGTTEFRSAVYFRGQRLGAGTALTQHASQMAAAESALRYHHDLFPQLGRQKRVLANKYACLVHRRLRVPMSEAFRQAREFLDKRFASRDNAQFLCRTLEDPTEMMEDEGNNVPNGGIDDGSDDNATEAAFDVDPFAEESQIEKVMTSRKRRLPAAYAQDSVAERGPTKRKQPEMSVPVVLNAKPLDAINDVIQNR